MEGCCRRGWKGRCMAAWGAERRRGTGLAGGLTGPACPAAGEKSVSTLQRLCLAQLGWMCRYAGQGYYSAPALPRLSFPGWHFKQGCSHTHTHSHPCTLCCRHNQLCPRQQVQLGQPSGLSSKGPKQKTQDASLFAEQSWGKHTHTEDAGLGRVSHTHTVYPCLSLTHTVLN